MKRLTVVCQQFAPVVAELSENAERILDLISDALDLGADVVVLPELATSGYVFESFAEVRSSALEHDSDVFKEWQALVAPSDAIAVVGFAELSADGHLYNSAAIVGRPGTLAVYRKVHLWDSERLWFSPGSDPPPVVNTPYGRIATMICYDLEFPEFVRGVALSRADLLAVPTNWPASPHPPDERPAEMLDAMSAARLNRMFIACADRVGSERGTDWTGGSCIVDPDGWTLAECPSRDVGTVVASVDVGRARDKSLNGVNDVLADRRPDVYRQLGLTDTEVDGS